MDKCSRQKITDSNSVNFYEFLIHRGAEKSLPDQEGNCLQRPNSNFFKLLKKKNSEICPSNQVSAAAMTSASDEKWRSFNLFSVGSG